MKSERLNDQLEISYYDMNAKKVLPQEEKRVALFRIRQLCREGGVRLSESEAPTTDDDVIVQAVLAVASDQGEFYDQTAVLLKACKKLQQKSRITRWPDIPEETNIFSRKLNRLTTVLEGYGIAVNIDHKVNGSYCTLRRLAHFQREPDSDTVTPRVTDGVDSQPSAASSALSPNRGKELRTDDDDDGASQCDEPNVARLLGPPPNPESSDSGNGQAVDVNGTHE